MTGTFTPLAAERLRALRRMKVIAGSLLVAAAVIYALCRTLTNSHGFWGYLQAAAEASMVGGLADWFAVTALFRHPLRLPIPHTAIIPNKKDALGNSLGDFVGSNFLSEEVVRDKLKRVEIARRLGAWLAEPDNAERVTSELATVVRAAVKVLRDEDVQAIMEQAVARRIIDKPWG